MTQWLFELDAACVIARAAGEMLLTRSQDPRQLEVQYKGAIDPVTEMDRRVEAFVREELTRRFPHHEILGEEGGISGTKSDSPRWLIDPLDGTTNYAHGYPCYAISMALEATGEIVLGVVYHPARDELFAARAGAGATLNGRPIAVSSTDQLGKSLLASGFPYDAWNSDRDNGREWHRMLKRVVSLRSDGSAALDLCHVAAGRLDGYWELDLEPWDMAAGALIVAEAGGQITRADGSGFTPYGRSVVASNGLIHDAIINTLQGE